MAEAAARTLVTSVLFLDVVGYSKKSVADQMNVKQAFNDALVKALTPIATADRVILDTGDGAAVTFLGNPDDALFSGLILQHSTELPVRMGINLGPVRIVRDLNGQTNILGDGINVGQRVMSFADPGQLVVSRSFYEVVSRLSDMYQGLFSHIGEFKDKHVRAHEIYSVNLAADALPRFVEATWGSDWADAVGLPTQASKDAAAAADGPALVFSTGSHFIVSGPSEISVLTALEELAKTGSKALSPISKLGNKWIATCAHPIAEGNGSKVEELGLMRIVTGPTREGVAEKLQELLQRGARLVHDVEQARGIWTAVCEVTSE
jgi:class 3 adenylate cyclase